MRSAVALGLIGLAMTATSASMAEDRWKTFPVPNPGWIESAQERGCAEVGNMQMYYAVFGTGEPVLFIHGGLGNANVWEDQVKALASNHKVIVADSRGHGRSTQTGNELHYRLMTDDYVALLDHLKIPKVAVVGWSDGGVIGLDMAMRYGAARLTKVFVHAANSTTGVAPSGMGRSAWNAYAAWSRKEYDAFSKTRCANPKAPPASFQKLLATLRPMWSTEPKWSDADLKKIAVPTAIVLGDHDEAISCGHTHYLARMIPDAKLLILPSVGHFAMRQDPVNYSAAVRHFVDGDPAPRLGTCRP
jgi:pimeloyl-ACP methyl ester carboxylesterase